MVYYNTLSAKFPQISNAFFCLNPHTLKQQQKQIFNYFSITIKKIGGIFAVVTNLTPNASERNIKSDMPSVVVTVTGFHMIIADVEGQIILCHTDARFC